MKTRSYFARKVVCMFLLAVLTLCICTPVLAASNTTTLTTTVPSHFDMNIAIVGKGTIKINGRNISESCIVPIERNQAVTVKITPDDGYYLSSVTYDGNEISQEVKDGYLTLPQPERELSIYINFAAYTGTPNTGDSSYQLLIFCSVASIISLLGMILLLIANRKKTPRT